MFYLEVAAVTAAVYALLGLCIAQEYERGVVFRLGRFRSVKGPGLYWIAPLFDRQWRLDLRTRTVTVEQQETITRDSVTIKVNAVLWYRIDNPEAAIVAVQNYSTAVYQLALTALRNIIGQHVLDEVLKERDQINETLKRIVDEATRPWGIHIEMVEMKDVEIPEAMQRAMAREAEAIREKRARLIKAEAESEAAEKLAAAAVMVAAHPAALELRRMQMVSEIGAEHNTTTIVLMPSEMVGMGAALARLAS
ncbi:MAG TPA: SPFH domain-containing protein [Rhizomicrobium sp.]|jgi:regulator of protease activity HflC (stomatin/prohibitin superfamily)|nr:SPFH domain-containing protein [Rhizomicrobium sp.]